ncbi:MAG: hypothetical protein AABX16_05185 [Nanoarchaeota archaeon]
MKKSMNKCAYTQLADSGMFFLCFIIIAAGIVLGVYLFYQNQQNLALVEASILSEKISGVFTDGNGFNQNVLKEGFDIFTAADLNREIIDNEHHYIRIEIFKDAALIKKIESGNRDFSVLCDLKGEQLPQCFRTKIVRDDYVIKIVSGVREGGGR